MEVKVVKPVAEIIYPQWPEEAKKELTYVGEAARVCYRGSLPKDFDNFDELTKFIRKLIENQHESPLEHASMMVNFVVDRGVANELVRHRIASYTQESTRYCNYANDKFGNTIEFLDFSGALCYDPSWRKLSLEQGGSIMLEWLDACKDAANHYEKLIQLGASPQIARGVLNLSTKTQLVMTANLREWRHFFMLRAANSTGKAHPQMQQVARMLLNEASSLFPGVFDDIWDLVEEEERA